MMTKIIRPNKGKKISGIDIAGNIVRRGGLVAFPTETVYGLGANALDKRAVDKIFVAKGRPQDNPLIVHIADKKDMFTLAKIVPKEAIALADRFWPGPLTMVLKKSKIVPDVVTAGLDSVAIRMPDNKIALELIRLSKVPIAAPSANVSGRPSPTSAKHVIDDLKGKIETIIDGGDTKIGVESTVIDLTVHPARILRPGGVTPKEIKKILGNVTSTSKVNGKISIAKSPGMKYRHYSPKASVVLVTGSKSEMRRKIVKLLETYRMKKIRVATIGFSRYAAEPCFICKNIDDLAKNLFRKLREFDDKNIKVIIVETVKEEGIGIAVMNRLKKAAVRIV